MTITFKNGNPPEDYVLRDAEPGWDSGSKIFKIGDGVTPWSELPQANGGESSGLKEYTSAEELSAVTTSEIGILSISNTASTYPELASFLGNGSSSLVVTTSVSDYPLDSESVANYVNVVQSMVLITTTGNKPLLAFRFAIINVLTSTPLSPFGTWTVSANVPLNTSPEWRVPVAPSNGAPFQYVEISQSPVSSAIVQRAPDGSIPLDPDVIPQNDGDAVHKRYVDSQIASITVPPAPGSGTYTLKSLNGVPTWVED